MKGQWIFVYKIVYYSVLDDYKKVKTHGITYADNYDEAMSNVMKYYGDESIEKIRLECAGEALTVLELPHFITKAIKGEDDE